MGKPVVFVRIEATNYQHGIEPNVWQLFPGPDCCTPHLIFQPLEKRLFNFPTPIHWSACAIYALFTAELHW